MVNTRVNKLYVDNVINVSSSDGKQEIDAGCAWEGMRKRYKKSLKNFL